MHVKDISKKKLILAITTGVEEKEIEDNETWSKGKQMEMEGICRLLLEFMFHKRKMQWKSMVGKLAW